MDNIKSSVIKESRVNKLITSEIKTYTTKICSVSEDFVSVYINGWYCAVNFSDPDIQSKQYKKNMDITFEYEGDLEKDTNGCFNLKILPLK